jgi:hypothetical protein
MFVQVNAYWIDIALILLAYQHGYPAAKTNKY